MGLINSFDWLKMTGGVNKVGGNVNNPTTSTQQNQTNPIFGSNNSSDLDVDAITDEFAELNAIINGEEVEETDAVEETATTQATTASKLSDEEKKEIEEKVKELEEEYEKNVEKMEKVQAEIETLAEEVAENITIAAAAQESAVKENEEQSQEAVDEQLKAYIEANKEGGEGMTREQLQENIKGAIPGAPNVGDALAAAIEANEQIADIDALLGELNTLTIDTKAIEDELNANSQLLDGVEIADATDNAAEESCKPKCEPQGFQDSENNQYDFFIDKDKNGTLSNETEFLGYEGGKDGQEAAWAEMTQLDVSGDGVVDASELAAGGVMVYKTDANGNQTAMTVEEAFGADSDLAISTQQHETAKEGIGPNNFYTGTGSENNELWGTFDVTLNGEKLNGYQTNDDIDWLKENYNFSDYAEVDSEGADVNEDELKYNKVQEFTEYIEMATERNELAKEQLAEIEKNLGFESDAVCEYKNAIVENAKANAASFVKSLDETQEESAETSEEVDKVEENEETNDVNTDMTDAEVEEQAQEDTTIPEEAIVIDGDEYLKYLEEQAKKIA